METITTLIASKFFKSLDHQIPAVKYLSVKLKEGKLAY